jgi:hypothetical protein
VDTRDILVHLHPQLVADLHQRGVHDEFSFFFSCFIGLLLDECGRQCIWPIRI